MATLAPNSNGECPYCGGPDFEGVDRPRGNDWVNKCLGCGGFCLHKTDDQMTYPLQDKTDVNSVVDDGGN